MSESEGNGSRPAGWVDFALAKTVPFERVIAAMDIAEQFTRYGNEYKGICPFHGGTKESFGFNTERGFKCHGCKRSGGNVLDFVNHKLFGGKDLKAAGRWLISLVDGSDDNDIPPAAEPAREEMPVLPASVSEILDESSAMTERDVAICRGVARYLASLFSTLGNVETIERELTRCVAEEVSAATRDV